MIMAVADAFEPIVAGAGELILFVFWHIIFAAKGLKSGKYTKEIINLGGK